MFRSLWLLFCAFAFEAYSAGKVVYETGFDSPGDVKGWEWSCNDVWKIEKGVGVDGSAALVWTNADPLKFDACSFEIPGIKAGQSYSATFKVKVVSHSGSLIEGTICWKDGEKWLGGAGGCVNRWDSGKLESDADGWYSMTVCTTKPFSVAANKALMQLYVKRGGTGCVVFDDVRIRLEGEKDISSVGGFLTSCYRNTAIDGDVRFVACTVIPREYWAPGKTLAELTFMSSDRSVRTVRMEVPDRIHVEATLPVSVFPMGRTKVTVTVKGYDGRVFGTRSLMFERVRKLPKRYVWIDGFGRTIVDGKPFFPIGMFWSIGTLEKVPDSLERYATGPFNCLQNYDHTLSAAELDRFWAKGLRVIVGVKDVFAPVWPNVVYGGKSSSNYRYARPKKGTVLKTWEDEDRYLTNLANSLKEHPALLGWFVCDEFRGEFHDRLKQHYELLKQVDPGHISCASILADAESASNFIDCMDVFWIDSYSIAPYGSVKVSKPDEGEAWVAADRVEVADKASYGLLQTWGVGQAFAHKWDHPHVYYPNRALLRFPTFKELKSQCWQKIAVGANGLIFYSYSQLLNSPDSEEGKEQNFRTVCKVAEEFRDLTGVLTLEPGPSVIEKPKRVRVRTWKDKDAVYALVCNTHPEERKGVLQIEGTWSDCSSIMGEGVKLSGKFLKLDMAPLGVAMVRLVPLK